VVRVTRVAVTSQVRFSGQAAYSGFFRVVDLEDGRTLLTEPVPESRWRSADPNPRGGLRGAKGISVVDDRLVVGNTDSLFVIDSAWAGVAELTHPFTGSIHDVLAEDDLIWVTCTNADLLLKLAWDGTELDRWSWRADAALVASFGLGGLPTFDPGVDYRNPLELQSGVHNAVHLNAVARVPEGLLLSFGRVLGRAEIRRRRIRAVPGRLAAQLGFQKPFPTKPTALPTTQLPGSSGAIVLLHETGDRLAGARAELLLRVEDILVPNHNVVGTESSLVYCDSNGSRLVAVDRTTGAERAAVAIPGDPAFVRGLARLADDVYLVGSQAPLALHAVDLARGEIAASYELDGADNESVYAVCPLPPVFADPTGLDGVFRRQPAQVTS
jgi:hypothetical protein